MKFIADLHIHSHFSRATSKSLDPEHIGLWAQKKGITVIGTGDFTHPGWTSELKDKLIEAEHGLYRLRPDLQKIVDSQVPASCPGPARFLLSGEISCIYKKNGKTRKVHNLILMPDMASVLRLNEKLDRIGNITSDGRPILGLDSKDLLEITLESNDRAFFIPAHIWTPWFSVFGSKSGFDSLEECFEDLTGHIHALETGLSSDPPMNRLLSALDDFLLVSNSDAHSPGKLGREANLFDTALDYDDITLAMTEGNGFLGTMEFYPEEGKYHLDGHRKCQTMLQPAETAKLQGVCPVCGKPLTIGVLHRILDLADRETPELSKDFFSLIPLPEILSELLSCGPSTKKVTSAYEELLYKLGPELQILMEIPLGDIENAGGPILAKAIDRMRQNQVICEEGYDGEYGIIHLFDDAEKDAIAGQMALFVRSPEKRSRKKPTHQLKKKTPAKKNTPFVQGPVLEIDPILGPLNPEQKSAVLHQAGHLMVLAGPGTGKTMTLTHRIAHLIHSKLAEPEQILALTFTRKAAREMTQRISTLLKGLESGQVRVSTFHAFCADLLRNETDKTGLPPDFTLCSEIDAANIRKEVLAQSGAGKKIIQKFKKALPKMKTISVLEAAGDFPEKEISSLFEKYQHRLRDLGMLDLDDLEVEALKLLRDHSNVSKALGKKYPWIFVDEYQDTNPVQVELLKAIVRSGSPNMFIIGDPDQAIYGFRGADVRNFHRFTLDFPGAEKVMLARNYRSTNKILQGAAALMGKEKPLQCESSEGFPLFLASLRTESEEAEMIVEQVERLIGGTTYFSFDSGRVASYEGEEELGFGDIGVLYRLNIQGNAVAEALDRGGIPFVRSGETALINRYPVNILWRFFQTLKYPDNPYYARMYDEFFSDGGERRKQALKAFEDTGFLPDLNTRILMMCGKLVDRAAAIHDFDCSSQEAVESLRILKQLADNFEGDIKGFLDVLSLERGIDHSILAGDRVALMSLHAAKGLEWPVVFITGCEDRLIPCSLFGTKDDEEERRLFYVGMTRARSRLILSHATKRTINSRALSMTPSPFLDALPRGLCVQLDRKPWARKAKAHKQLKLF